MTTISQAINAAQELADHFGWIIFPVNPRTKAPYFCGWQKLASNKPEEIKDLFTRLRYAAIGVCTGKASKLVVVDIDERGDFSGRLNFELAGYSIPSTPIVKTPSGGLHLYFEHPPFKVSNSASIPAQGVDLRGEGGYIISAPSSTVFGRYIWTCSETTFLRGPSKMPNCLAGALQHIPNGSRSGKKTGLASQILTPIMQGSRNREVTRRIGFLLGKYNANQSWEMTQLINQQCCLPPLDERELSHTFHSIRNREDK